MNNELLYINDDEDLGANEYPFDPSKIDIVSQQQSIFNLVERIKHREINLSPEFQRHPDLWKVEVQSRLIESLILGIPLQAFYFDVEKFKPEDADADEFLLRRSRWNVVDGLQRLSSIKNFVLEGQRLDGLEYLKSLNGKRFEDLSPSLQRSILETTVLVYLIKDGTPEDIKFNIFKRVNTGGMPLTQQEIRHALFNGKGTDLIIRITKSSEFSELIKFADNARMLDREFVNRYLAFYLLDIKESFKSMDIFLNDALRYLNKLTDAELEDIYNRTIDSLRVVKELMGRYAFRRYRTEDGKWSQQVNKALFEVTMANMARLSTEDRNRLTRVSTFVESYQRLFETAGMADSLTFDQCVNKSTGDRKRVIGRHDIFAEFLNKLLGDGHDSQD